jgi:hypothetical protein
MVDSKSFRFPVLVLSCAALSVATGCSDDDTGDPATDAAAPDDGALDGGPGTVLDGSTDAAADGASEADAGTGVACTANAECEAEEYCARPCHEEGTCQARPTECPDVDDPVCGCNGLTYDSECDAHLAGVNVASDGECEGTCLDSEDCEPTETCVKATGQCDAVGQCEATPGCITPMPGDEVCGCDGNDYDSECFAHEARVSVAHEGSCEVESCDDPEGDCCFEDEHCDLEQRCVGAICSPRGELEGTCVTSDLDEGQCWVNADCSRGEVCVGVQRCPCGSVCRAADEPGECQSIIIRGE